MPRRRRGSRPRPRARPRRSRRRRSRRTRRRRRSRRPRPRRGRRRMRWRRCGRGGPQAQRSAADAAGAGRAADAADRRCRAEAARFRRALDADSAVDGAARGADGGAGSGGGSPKARRSRRKKRRGSAQAALDAARPGVQEIEAALNRLEAEAQTLARVLQRGGESLWPAIVDSLKVTPGYETALGAALGRRPRSVGRRRGAAALGRADPGGGRPCPARRRRRRCRSLFRAATLLDRRLDQIGVVDKPRTARGCRRSSSRASGW